jgi:hypothetical protein
MENIVGLGTFGTFGSPYGFQQIFFYQKTHFTRTLDLNPNAIELNPNSEIFAVYKEFNDGIYSICFCLYTYALEPESGRKGSFIGSCIVFDNCASRGIYIYECLREFHSSIIADPKNLIDNVLQVNQAKDLVVQEPNGYKKILEHIESLKIKPGIVEQNSFLIAAPNLPDNELKEDVSYFFKKAVESYAHIGTLYFTTNPNVIEYVQSKGLITIVSLEEFEEKTNSKKDPAKPNSVESTNEQKRQSYAAQSSKYNESQSQVDYRFWGRPQSTWDINETKNRVEEHNTLVKYYNRLEGQYYDLLDAINTSPNKIITIPSKSNKDNNTGENWLNRIIESLTPKRLLISIGVIILFIFVIYIYNSFYSQETSTDAVRSTTPDRVQTTTQAPTPNSRNLYPIPNSELNENDLKILNAQLITGMRASEVATIAIETNPTDIKQTYFNQRDIFAEKIVEMNADCFDESTRDPKLKCKTLQHIPTYKRP